MREWEFGSSSAVRDGSKPHLVANAFELKFRCRALEVISFFLLVLWHMATPLFLWGVAFRAPFGTFL